jgi:hypothetical protein
MSLKLKALLQLVGLTAFAAGVSLSIDWVFATFPRETVGTAIGLGAIAFIFYLGYSLLLTRLESLENIRKISENIKEITNK